MPKRKQTLTLEIAGVLVLSIGIASFVMVRAWRSAHQARLDEAYLALLSHPSPPITNRHYEVRGAFTDTVERFWFEGGDQTLVQALIQRHHLQPVEQPLESKFSAPDWWVLPPVADYYLRGTGHEYALLVFDPATGQIFFERTQD